MLVKFDSFKGQNKLLPKHLLPIEYGQESINTYIEDGTFLPMKEELQSIQATPFSSATKTVYKHRNTNTGAYTWREFSDFTTVVRHPRGDDTYQRIFYVDSGKLKFIEYSDTYVYDALLPQPNPQSQLTVNVTNTGTTKRFIAYTLVNSFGDESALSITTTGTGDYLYGNYYIDDLSDTSSITVTWDKDTIIPAGGNYNNGITTIRFYMTPVTTVSDDYRFVGEALITAETITIDNAGLDISLEEEIDSPVKLTYSDYATTTLIGVSRTVFGSIIVFDKGNFYVSGINKPTSFSATATYSVESDLNAVTAFGNNLLLSTNTVPFVVTGNDPSSLVMEKASKARSCLNTNCIVDLDNFICVPTDEGVYVIGTDMFKLGTETMFSDKQWKDITGYGAYLYSACQYKNLYLLNLTTNKTLVFDFVNNSFWELDYNIKYGYYDSLEQTLWVYKPEITIGSLWEFNEGTAYRTAKYLSGRHHINTPVGFKYIKVFAEDYTGTINIKLYDRGVLKFTKTITDCSTSKLPTGLYCDIELEIEANVQINFVAISNTIEEIQGVS